MTNRAKQSGTKDTGQDLGLVTAVAERLLWESENGVSGYRRATEPRPSPATTGTTSGADSPGKSSESFAHDAVRSMIDQEKRLADLREEIGDCTRCELHRGRTQLVFGQGNPQAELVFVGEGPGREEDRVGLPFVGPAGQLLDRIIAAIGLERSQVYIGNVVKCRPPQNRVPNPVEMSTCGPNLSRQLEVIDPKVIVALGSTASRYLLNADQQLGRLRGRFHTLGRWQVMPTYHPAYLLRNPGAKRAVWSDMLMVHKELGLPPIPHSGNK